MSEPVTAPTPRRVFILLSSQALPYARHCVRTLLAHAAEPVHLTLIGDDPDEIRALEDGLAEIDRQGHELQLIDKGAVLERLADRFPALAGLRALHEGHPCWRKITDPLALSAADEEIIVADPDLLFPNRFRFEDTLPDGVMMMRQGPTCLYPPEAVEQAFGLGVALADHVDIGVLQLRAGAVDLEWLDWFCRHMDLGRFTAFMHIEAIVWSALAMRMGGRHLDPGVWRCWERGHLKRVAVALGLPGYLTLKLENLPQLKCIHVSGPSKWWVTRAIETGAYRDSVNDILAPSAGPAYAELTPEAFARQQRLKRLAAKAGYYRLTQGV